MKKYLLIMALGLSMVANAQIVSEQEQALVYYMPWTEIAIDVKYETEIFTPGKLAAFASMIGVDDAITEADTIYRIVDIETGTRTTADKQRVYKVLAEPNINLQLLSINKKGLLAGYNHVQGDNVPSTKDVQRNKEQGTRSKEQKVILPAPLTEDGLKAETDTALAEAVLDQIMRLREARLYLLTGESENPPKDGRQLEATLRAIHEEEQQLVALFVGRHEIKREHRTLYYTPDLSTEVVIARWNEHKGLVDAKEIGEPITLTITTNRQRLMTAGSVKKDKKAPQPSPIYYNLPGDAHYTLRVGEKEWADRTIWVAQFGVSVPLTRDLFVGNDTKIIFNTHTGNVESICKLVNE